MLHDVVEAQARGGHRLFLRFDDGQSGEIDLGKLLRFTGVFAPLRDPAAFAKVFVHPEFRTVSWPNDVDLDTEVLYARVTGAPLPGTGAMPATSTPRRKPASKKRVVASIRAGNSSRPTRSR